MIFAGIDPGLDGAVAFIFERDGAVQETWLLDTPTLKVGTKREYNIPEMLRQIKSAEANGGPTIYAAIESVHSMPEQGVASSFSFGRGLGLWEGILAALAIPYTKVPPQRWKKALMDGMQKEKGASRVRAMQLFPDAAARLNLIKHHGRADALLMAEYVRRSFRGALVGEAKAPHVADNDEKVLRGG